MNSRKSEVLKSRILNYLEQNKQKKFVDIDDMCRNLHSTYEEYRKTKLKVFHVTCEKEFSRLKAEITSSRQIESEHEIISDDSPRATHEPDQEPKEKKARIDDSACNVMVVDLTETPDHEEETQSSAATNGGLRGNKVSPAHSSTKSAKKIPRAKKGFDISAIEPAVTFNDLGGIDHIIIQVCQLLIHLKHPEVYRHIGVSPVRGLLLHGPPGCGKSLLAHAIAGQFQLPLLKVAATEIVSGISGESESKLRDLFEKARSCSPCILFIDEIDAITQRRDTANKSMECRIVGQLIACMDDLNQNATSDHEGQIVVIGATNRPDVLDPALRRSGRFEREVAMGIPDEQARLQMLRVMCRNLKMPAEFDLLQLARITPGYVGADLNSLVREAALSAAKRVIFGCDSTGGTDQAAHLQCLIDLLHEKTPLAIQDLENVLVEMTDFSRALKVVQPSAKREGFATVPNVSWSDVGALNDVRQELEMSILAPVNHPEASKALGLEDSTGTLLCGPPGCGKTLIAKAVANQSGLNFISVKGPELLNMYVGESERAVRQVFQRAKNSAPCVIFFDELDSLCPRRNNSGDASGANRVVNQLLTEMDGIESRKGVFVMAATNRIDIIDPAVLRPGRLQKILFVDLPSQTDRKSILQALTRRRPLLHDDVDFDAISSDSRCKHFSGADLSALVTEAATAAFKDHLDGGLPCLKVHSRHFEEAFTKVKASVSDADYLRYQCLKKMFATSQCAAEGSEPAKAKEPSLTA